MQADRILKTSRGYSLVEMSVATFLLGLTGLIVGSVIYLTLGERRASRQEATIGDVARQTDAILRSSQKCLRLVRCNLAASGASINPNALGPVNFPRGVADFDDSCVASTGTIAAAGTPPLGDPTLAVSRVRLANPSLIAYNSAASTGTFSTVTYNLEIAMSDVSPASSSASAAIRPIVSTLSLVVDGSGQAVSCSNLGRAAPSTVVDRFAPCGSGDPTIGIGTLSVSNSVCAPAPTCPNNNLDCTAMSALLSSSSGTAPAIYFDGMTASSSASATSSYCSPTNLTLAPPGGFLSGSTVIGGITVGDINTLGGPLRVNAGTVGNVLTQTSSETMIVARTVGNVQTVANVTQTCISAQNISSITGQGGYSIFGRKEGGVRGNLGSVGFGSTSATYVIQGFNITSNISGQAGNLTIRDSTMTTATLDAAMTTLDGVVASGDVWLARNGSAGTFNNVTVNGMMSFANTTTATVTGSTFNAGSTLTNGSNVTLTNSTVKGSTTINNFATLTVGAGATVENVVLTQGAVLNVQAGGKVTGYVDTQSSQFGQILITGAGSSVQRLWIRGQSGPTLVQNGAQINVLDGTNQTFSVGGGAYSINCSATAPAGRVLARQAGSIMPPAFGGITLTGCGIP